jgi:hypothetical protein
LIESNKKVKCFPICVASGTTYNFVCAMQDFDLWRLGPNAVRSIVHFLDAIPDLFLVSKVCKSWRKAVFDFGEIKRLRLSYLLDVGEKMLEFLSGICRVDQSVEEIILENWTFNGKSFSSISAFFGDKGLKSIEIRSCRNVQDSKISALLYSNRDSMEKLIWTGDSQKQFCKGIVSKCLMSPRGSIEERYPKLQVFDFPLLHCGEQFCSLTYFRNAPLRILNIPLVKVSSEDFLQLGLAFDYLEELSIYLRHSQRGSKFVFPNCPQLWSLELPECNFKHSTISFNLPNLTRLSLRAADIASIEGTFPKLEYLDMSWTMLPASVISKLFIYSNCKNLIMGQFDGSLIDEEALTIVETIAKSARLYVHSCRSIPISVRKKMRLN